jgi:hypothetical protein
VDWLFNTQGSLVVAGVALFVTGAVNALPDSETTTPSVEKGGHEVGEPERTIIFGVGGVAEVELGDGSLHLGPNAFLEYEAVENWLELELSASVLAVNGGREVPIDLLFKKPFRLSRRLELMIGIGPQIVFVSGTEKNGTFVSGEIALDFMFWPSRHVGFWVEPSYDFSFRGNVRLLLQHHSTVVPRGGPP